MPQPGTQPDIEPETPSERLRRALLKLEAAQAEQRAALVVWKDALASLRTSVSGLHANLSVYQARLSQIRQS